MKIRVLIDGQRHDVAHEPGVPHLELDRRCQACGGPLEGPLLVIGHASRQTRGHDTITAPALALCCGAEIGTVVVEVATVFGLEQDDELFARVVSAGGRVYG